MKGATLTAAQEREREGKTFGLRRMAGRQAARIIGADLHLNGRLNRRQRRRRRRGGRTEEGNACIMPRCFEPSLPPSVTFSQSVRLAESFASFRGRHYEMPCAYKVSKEERRFAGHRGMKTLQPCRIIT